MSVVEVVPGSVRVLIDQNLAGVNPGLRLDKYIRPGKMEQQQQELKHMRLHQDSANQQVLREARERRKAALLQATFWTRKTCDSLALHLARASSLENAAICLHPVYGFPVLPGTGLKGMSRAYAETVWAPQQADAQAAWDRIHAVFGVGDETDKKKSWKPEGLLVPEKDKAGSVVFHDAWPTIAPKLQIDFATPHQGKYYKGEDHAGDWQEPVPAAFLSLPAETEFEFIVAPASHCADVSLVEHAREWLNGALSYLGAGAKTTAGYGHFYPLPEQVPAAAAGTVSKTFRLKLTTPGFFAGDQEDPRSCRLRGGTLRGLLRWWWRTMHAGYLTKAEMLKLEKEIWGGIADDNAKDPQGSAVRIRVRPLSVPQPRPFDREATRTENRLPWTERGQRITPGLTFLSYGMNDGGKKRWYLPSGATWEVTVTARESTLNERSAAPIPAQRVLREAENALWLLSHFGGLGAKSRKAFGCLAMEGTAAPSDLKQYLGQLGYEAHELRMAKGLVHDSAQADAVPGSLGMLIPGTPVELALGRMPPGEQGIWAAIHRLGSAIRMFSAANKHRPEKRALGTPRKMDRDQRQWPERHSSPVHYHLFERNGEHYVRVLAFPSPRLPDLNYSYGYLKVFVQHLVANLSSLQQTPAVTGYIQTRPPTVEIRRTPAPGDERKQASGTSTTHKVDDLIDGELVELTKKRKWRAKAQSLSGTILDSEKVPFTAKIGDKVRLKIAAVSGANSNFRFDGLL